MKNNNQESNKKHNFIITLVSIILVFIITMYLMYSYTKSTSDNVRHYAEFSVAQNSRRITDEISSIIDYSMCSIREVSDVITKNIETHENENPKDIINVVLENTPFTDIEFINSDGINLTDAGERFDANDRVYFKEGIQGNTGIWINYNPKYSEEALLNFYTPIYKNEKIIGVITGYLGGDKDILPILRSSFFGNETREILCDENGIVITSTFGYSYGTKLENLAKSVGKIVSDRDEYINNLQSNDERLSYYNDKYGQALAYTCRVKDTNWYLIQVVPGSSLSQVVGQLSQKAYVTVGCIIMIFILIIVEILIDNRKKRLLEQQYIDNIESINESLQKEKLAMTKIHETISSGSWFIEFDKNGEIEASIWSDGFRKLLGYHNENEFPNNIKSLNNVVDDDINNTISKSFWDAALDSTDQSVFDVEYQVRTRLEGLKWFRAAGRFSRYENGKPKTFYGLIIDIEERKKNEEKLKKEQLRLENSLKEQLRLEEDVEKTKVENNEITKSYIKILKVNLTDDKYSVIQINEEEKNELFGYSDKISEWLYEFANTDNVHPDDKEEYLNKTNIDYLRNYFDAGNQHFHIRYRRKNLDTYQNVLLEVVPEPTYNNNNQEVILYVKDIN